MVKFTPLDITVTKCSLKLPSCFSWLLTWLQKVLPREDALFPLSSVDFFTGGKLQFGSTVINRSVCLDFLESFPTGMIQFGFLGFLLSSRLEPGYPNTSVLLIQTVGRRGDSPGSWLPASHTGRPGLRPRLLLPVRGDPDQDPGSCSPRGGTR